MLTPTVTSASQLNQPAARTTQNNLGSKDIFLKLLVAQMQFQNPMKPQDPTQMSSQLAQFNMVEQQTTSNTLLQKLIDAGAAGSASATAGGANYLGHTVTINESNINFDGTNPQPFDVSLDAAASAVQISVTDANGNVVRTAQLGAMTAGNTPLTWDGTTDTGTIAPAGAYTLSVTALDAGGNAVGCKVQRTGIVDAVRFGANGTELMVGGIAASLANITEIRP
ncbi:flagellar hook capping protein [Mariprofundus erugo]|uniref:Basal-body rod modification protein FlgD n=1 Tax=Mariprofundus erugo TaxID=2528639 RepID=A0A5R9GW15_9PROT|nr:FlgD immunoglobulin-like domain containing protein [Mariprofundus erugo]TLS68949.1 flagellar hook capping protein [Mariprofundus erugo]